MKYVVVAGISLIVAVFAGIMGNVLSGILIFGLLFGGYILLNVTKVMKTETSEIVLPPSNSSNSNSTKVINPPKDN